MMINDIINEKHDDSYWNDIVKKTFVIAYELEKMNTHKNQQYSIDYKLDFMDFEKLKFSRILRKLFEKWKLKNEIGKQSLFDNFKLLYSLIDNKEMAIWIMQYYILFGLIGEHFYKQDVIPNTPEMMNVSEITSRFFDTVIEHDGLLHVGHYHIDSDPVLMMTIWAMECYEQKGICEPVEENIVMDIGASKGESAIWFYNRIGANGKIYSFEMKKDFINIMENNIKRNNIKNIDIIENGVWECETKVLMDETGRITSVSDNGYQTITLDNFVKENNIERVDYIKMDIEGAELYALRGARVVIKKFKPKLAIAAYHHINDPWELILYIRSIDSNYRFYLSNKDNKNLHLVLFAYIDEQYCKN